MGVIRGLQWGLGWGGHFSTGLWVWSGRSEYQVKGVVKGNKAEGGGSGEIGGPGLSAYSGRSWIGVAVLKVWPRGLSRGLEVLGKYALVQGVGVRTTGPRHSPTHQHAFGGS